MSDSLQPHELQHARCLCPSLSPRACLNSCPLSQWCRPTISSSFIPFSSCPQTFPASGSFPMSQLFTSGGQSIGSSASASVLPMNLQDWFILGWTALLLLQSKDFIPKVCSKIFVSGMIGLLPKIPELWFIGKWVSNDYDCHWKRPWCWEWLKARGGGDDREWDGWMASPSQFSSDA